MKFLKVAGALAALSLTAFVAAPASANMYDLTKSDPSSGIPNNVTYGTVTTTLAANGLDVNVSVSLLNGAKFVTTGGPHDTFTFNLNDATWGVSNILFNGSAVGGFALVSPGTNPSFGTFSGAIDCSSCQNGNAGADTPPLTFTVTGTTLAAFQPNDSGFTFSADIVLADGKTTGAVGNGGFTPGVPEPATWAMMILGMGMVGAGMRMRRRFGAATA